MRSSSPVQVDSGATMFYELLRRLILLDRHDPYMAYGYGAVLCPEILFIVVHIFPCTLE